MGKKILFFMFFIIAFIHITKPVLAAEADAIQSGDTASNVQEFEKWMKEHKKLGGVLSIEEDFIIDTTMYCSRQPGAEPAVIELNGHNISISGYVEMYGYDIKNSQKDANITVLPGGSLYLEAGTLQGGENPLIWQEEGSFLYVSEDVLGNYSIHYAEVPVVGYLCDEASVVLLLPDEDINERLAKTLRAVVCYQGALEEKNVPVTWNLTEQAVKDSLSQRCRTQLSGSFEIPFVQPPYCTVAFKNQPITLTNETIQGSKEYCIVMFFASFSTVPISVESQYSFDGINYLTAGEKVVQSEEEKAGEWAFTEEEFCGDGFVRWNSQQYPNVYLRLKWLDAPEETGTYSDVVILNAASMQITGDISGSRGGGIDIISPPELPKPPDSSEIPKLPESSEPPESPEPPESSETPNLPDLPKVSNPSQPPEVDEPLKPAKKQDVDDEQEYQHMVLGQIQQGEDGFLEYASQYPDFEEHSTEKDNMLYSYKENLMNSGITNNDLMKKDVQINSDETVLREEDAMSQDTDDITYQGGVAPKYHLSPTPKAAVAGSTAIIVIMIISYLFHNIAQVKASLISIFKRSKGKN